MEVQPDIHRQRSTLIKQRSLGQLGFASPGTGRTVAAAILRGAIERTKDT
jgi:K+-transporting ATPase A subunit